MVIKKLSLVEIMDPNQLMPGQVITDPNLINPAYYNFPMPTQQDAKNEITLVSQTNPQTLLDEFEHKLKGEIKELNDNGEEKWIKKFDAIANNSGIQSIIVDLGSIVNQNTILSNLEEDDIRKLTVEFGKMLTFKLMIKYKTYDIQKSNLNTIVMGATSLVFISLKRGFKEGERKFLKTTVRSQEHLKFDQSQQEKEKFTWKFWKW